MTIRVDKCEDPLRSQRKSLTQSAKQFAEDLEQARHLLEENACPTEEHDRLLSQFLSVQTIINRFANSLEREGRAMEAKPKRRSKRVAHSTR